MAKKKSPAPKSSWVPGGMALWMARCALVLALVAGLLYAIIGSGRWSAAQLLQQPAYQLPVGDIHCEPPPGVSAAEFLEEVQYHARLAGSLPLLDPRLEARLRDAFTRHPWVDKVAEVQITPPRHVTVRLTYRKPVLAVAWEGELRAVDGQGILLPKQASTDGLPVYEGTPKPPQGPPGTRWGDPAVEQHARKLRR